MPEYLVLPLGGFVWFGAWLLCILNAYIPDKPITPRTRARLLLTGWLFPLAAPIWISVFIWFLVRTLTTATYDTFRTAFSRTERGTP